MWTPHSPDAIPSALLFIDSNVSGCLFLLRLRFYPQLNLWQLIQSDLEFQFVDRFQLDPRIQSRSSHCAGLQVVTQSTYLRNVTPPSIKFSPFQNSTKKVTGVQMHATILLETLHKKMKFPILDFFSKCDKICRKLYVWSHLPRKSLMGNFVSSAVRD